MHTFIVYLVVAMLTWSPARMHKPRPEAETIAYYNAIARDVATVTLDPNEQPLFPGDMEKAETALQLVAMALKEGGYWRWVDDGSCNKRSWRLEHGHAKDCDGGHAYSLWQIHTGYTSPSGWRDGIVLEGGGWKNDPDGVTGKDLVADRETAARVALHFMRQSLRGGSLCGYTGEPAGSGCPKAKERRALAHDYFVAHPYRPGADGAQRPSVRQVAAR